MTPNQSLSSDSDGGTVGITIRPTFNYSQKTGVMRYAETGVDYVLCSGYSGFDAGKNNPDMQEDIGIGPVCRGLYTFGAPENSLEHGPLALALIPDPSNEMFGRSGFMCHGDSVLRPGFASRGCIIIPRGPRNFIALKYLYARLVVVE